MKKMVLLLGLIFLSLGATMWSSNSIGSQIVGLIFILLGAFLFNYSNKVDVV